MANYVAGFLGLVSQFGLYERYPDALGPAIAEAQMGRMSQMKARAWISQIEPLIIAQERRPNLLPRAPEHGELYPNGDPDLIVGKLSERDDVPLGLSLSGNVSSILAGRSGAGKTNAIRALISAVMRHNGANPDRFVSLLCWDRKGGDYTDYAQDYDNCIILGFPETLRIGLNPPEGVKPNVWINHLCSTFAARAGLVASSVCLANMMRFLLTAMNPYPDQHPLRWPSFELLLDLARAAPLNLFAAKPDYEKSLIQQLECFAHAAGELFSTFGGLDVERDVVRRRLCAVLDVEGLGPASVRAFTTDILNLQLLVGRQARRERGDSVNCIQIIDEADQDTSQKAESAFPDLSPISLMLKQGREFRLGVILGLSAVGPTARMVTTNASHFYAFAMADAPSMLETRNTLVLPRGAEAILPALEPGECLYRGPGPWPHAALARLDYVAPCRAPRPSRYDTHPFIPARRLRELPHVMEALDRLIAEHRRTTLRQARKRKPESKAELTSYARKLLDLCSLKPYTPVARLWEEVGTPAFSVQAAARAELEGAGFAAFEESRVGRRNLLLMLVTDRGWTFLGKAAPKRKGRGGIAHTHFCEFIRWVGERRGYKASTEMIVPGTNHPVDVAWQVAGRLDVFEVISASEANLPEHLRACFIQSDCVASVTVVSSLRRDLAHLEELVLAQLDLMPFINRISYDSVETYIQELWP